MSNLISCIWSSPSWAVVALSKLLSLYDLGVVGKCSFRSWPDTKDKVDELFDKMLWIWAALFAFNLSLGV